MRTIELNIGLGNNPHANSGLYTASNIISEMLESHEELEILDFDFVTSVWVDQPERTMVVLAKFEGSEFGFKQFLQDLCEIFNQTAIAGTYSGGGHLVYDRLYFGDKDRFDFRYFKTIQSYGGGMTGGLLNTGVRRMDGVINR